MAQQGMCSRREADRFIEQGLVYVNGEVVSQLGVKILPGEVISLDPKAITAQSKFATVLINKPPGYVSGLPEKDYQSAVMLITKDNAHDPSSPTPDRFGMAPAGRLDIDSTGLIVFTQDGRIARTLISPDNNIEKEYRISVEGKITKQKLDTLRHGLTLDGKPLKPAIINKFQGSRLGFILTEGRKRQIRRMCDLVELKVTRLERIRIGNVILGNLERGQWRLLGPDESFIK